MNVLLKQAVPPHGKPGDVIAVSDSYARNFLLPRGIAVAATAAVVAEAAAAKKRKNEQQQVVKQEQAQLAARLPNLTIHLSARANANGKLYAALQAADVVRGLRQEYQVRTTGLRFSGLPIKTLGQTSLGVSFPDGQTATLLVDVAALP